MRIGDARSPREIANVLLDAKAPAAEFVSPERLREAARAQRLHERTQKIMNSGKEELKRSDLRFEKYWILHTPTGQHFRLWGGDVDYSTGITAFYVDESGMPLLLERVGSQAEHDKKQAKRLGAKWKLLFVTIEQGALRLGEAVSLRWADVDAAALRLRLPKSATKRDRARWVYLPEWLMQTIEETCPLEDRVPERKVFQGITEASAYQAMSRACKTAKVPHYHPHDLRHRRITIWHQSGVPARELAERAGHARPSMSLDVYSHVMPPDELAPERVLSLLTDEGR